MSKFRSSKTITTAAMLISIAVILGFFKIPVTQVIEIRFGSLPLAVAGSLLGPVIGGVVGALSDILGYIVKPTGPFFPGFTFNSIVSGVIYGLMLKPDAEGNVSIKRIVLSKVICTVIVNMLLNTLWLSMLYGNAFKALFFTRLPKELIMFPINTILLIAAMKPIKKFKYYSKCI
ncbi:MAG: folate family ECF transporter S component [Lachnospiraceae bacterium]|nr:folate family ECF transporter S component [Lachnospiraceae bacterium]